jgi:hypothetical protein
MELILNNSAYLELLNLFLAEMAEGRTSSDDLIEQARRLGVLC